MRNDHIKRMRKGMMKLFPIPFSNQHGMMTEEKENTKHFKDKGLHSPQKRHPMPLPMDLYNQLENSEPNEPKVLESKDKHTECQGDICQNMMPKSNTTKTFEPEETNSKTLIDKATAWLAGIRFNVYHLVFHLIRELEKSLYRREQEKKMQLSE